jgi:hypothetical protein
MGLRKPAREGGLTPAVWKHAVGFKRQIGEVIRILECFSEVDQNALIQSRQQFISAFEIKKSTSEHRSLRVGRTQSM